MMLITEMTIWAKYNLDHVGVTFEVILFYYRL